jgi:hypothetical protein
MTARQTQRAAESGGDLRRSFDVAAAFTASVERQQPLSSAETDGETLQDLSAGAIIVDENGLTCGARAAIVMPFQLLLQRWQALQAVFLAALEPKRADIDAVQTLPQAIADVRAKRADDIERLRQRWADRPRNALVAQQWHIAQTVYEQESLRHGHRLATMAAYSPFYWIALLFIGVADQHRRCGHKFFRARKRLEAETQIILEHTNREVGAMENGALSRHASSEAEPAMLAQIGQYDLAVVDALRAHLRTDVARYRADLVRRMRMEERPRAIIMKRPDGGLDRLSIDLYAEMPTAVERLLERAE